MKYKKLIKNVVIPSFGIIVSLNSFTSISYAQGVPFAVTQGNDHASSNSSDLPPSDTPMNMNQKMVNNVINKTQSQSNVRLNQLIGKTSTEDTLNQKEKLSPPDLSGSQDDLQAMQDIQKKIRLLSLQKEEAQAAIDLWKMLFDVNKEKSSSNDTDKELPDDVKINKDAESNDINQLKNQFLHMNPTKNNKPKISDINTEPKVTTPPSPVVVEHPYSKQEMSLNENKAKDFVPPEAKVVIIGGSGEKRYATVLIPYIGEQDVKIGDSLPGGRKVYSITESSGVTVREKNGSHTILSFGSSVPADVENSDNNEIATSAD